MIPSYSKDDLAETAGNITAAFLQTAVKEIDDCFGEGYAKKNLFLIASYMKAAAIKNHGDALAEQIGKLVEVAGDLIESIDYAGAKLPDFWITSELAALDKARELNIDILPEWSVDDLRYKIHQALNGGIHG